MRQRVVVVALVGALLAAGCTNDSGVKAATQKADTSTTVAVPTETDAPQPTDPPPGTTVAGQPVPIDNGVTIETLDNGLTVYIRENDSPGGEAQLRLAINAGSVLEDPDQSAVAHFLEHMLFNGTAKYPANELIDALQGFGMEFGADINAYTSHDETVYELSVPTSDSDQLTAGIDILAEWLSAARLDPDQVTKERGVVLDEWRQSDASFNGRVFDTIEKLFFTGSAYEGRDPIGTDEAIEVMTPELLRRFYDRWYRPDNAAVVIVGDVDADQVMKEIKERFDPLIARGDAPARPVIGITPSTSPSAAVILDPDTVDGLVELTLPVAAGDMSTIEANRDQTVLAMAFDMIGNRLSDDISRGTLPFTSAQVDSNSHVRPLDAPSVMINTTADSAKDALQSVVDEFERARRFGFGQGELDRVVASYRSASESAYESADSTQDVDFAGQYVANFLSGEPIPSADDQFRLITEVLDGVTLDNVAAAFTRRLKAGAPHVLIVGPEADSAKYPTEADALAALAAAGDRPLEARADEVFEATALMAAPEPVEETSSDQLAEEPGVFLEPRLLTFPNGARVILNPNTIAAEAVAFGATSPGGLSLVADADVGAAQLMPQVMQSSGLGDLDPVQLEAVLADSSVEFQPFLDQTSENLSGGVATADLETLFQLINLSFTAPRFEQAAFDNSIDSIRPYVEDTNSDPGLASSVALSTARYGDLARFRVVPTPTELDAVTLDAMQRVWGERFGPATDWVFVFSGDFGADTITDLARRYIGSLPGGGTPEEWVDLQPDAPATPVTAEVASGTGEQAGIQLLFTGTSDGRIVDSVMAEVLSTVASSRLTDHVREELGATYSPSVYSSVATEPDVVVETYVDVSGASEGIDKLSEVVRQDLADLQANGPTEQDLSEAVAEIGRNYELFDNGTLLDLLLGAADDPEMISEFLRRPKILSELTLASVGEFAKRALPADHYIEVRVRPA